MTTEEAFERLAAVMEHQPEPHEDDDNETVNVEERVGWWFGLPIPDWVQWLR